MKKTNRYVKDGVGRFRAIFFCGADLEKNEMQRAEIAYPRAVRVKKAEIFPGPPGIAGFFIAASLATLPPSQ